VRGKKDLWQRQMRVPFVQEYWIGANYLHRDSERRGALHLPPPGVKFRNLFPEDVAEIVHSSDPQLQRRQAQPGEGMTRHGAWLNGKLVGVCTFAWTASKSKMASDLPTGSRVGQVALDAATAAIGDFVLGERGEKAGGWPALLSDCSASFAHMTLTARKRSSD
jgi:hypothetical protein